MNYKNCWTALLLIHTIPTLAAKTFTGVATHGGNSCEIYPNPKEAELDCSKQANEFCSTFGKRASQVTEYSYGNSCQRGAGYANGERFGTTTATAGFNCDP